MEGRAERRKAPNDKEKPKRHGGAQGFTRAMLLATLAAFNAPEHAKAEMPPGVNAATRAISRDARKDILKDPVALMDGMPTWRETLQGQSRWFKEYFKKHPHMIEDADSRALKRILSDMEAVSDTSVKGTEYDFRGMPAGQTQLEGERYGNGIALRFYEENAEGPGLKERYVLVTARHVAAGVPTPNGKEWTNHPTADVSVVELSREESIMYAPLFLGRTHANDDLAGEIVTVLGIDTDGEKRFPAILSPRLTASAYAAMQITPIDWTNEENAEQIGQQRLIVLPKEETEQDPTIDPRKRQVYAVAGMSGSPLVYIPKGGKGVEFAGLLIAGARIPVDGKQFSLGMVVDQAQVWEAIHQLSKPGEAPKKPVVESSETERPLDEGTLVDDAVSWFKKQGF